MSESENTKINNEDLEEDIKIPDFLNLKRSETESDNDESCEETNLEMASDDVQMDSDETINEEESSGKTVFAQEDTEKDFDAEGDSDEELLEDDDSDAKTNSLDEFDINKTVDEKMSSAFKVWLVTSFVKLKKVEKKKLIRCSIIALAVIVLIVLVFTDIIPILPNSYHRSYVGNKYELGETQGSIYKSFGDNILYADNNRIMCFGPDMNVEKKIDDCLDNPLIRVNGGGAIVYSQGERRAVVFSDYTSYRTIELDDKIKKASVNSSGDYVLISDKSGFESDVAAYNLNGELLYERNTNKDVIDAVLTEDTKVLVLSNLEVSDSAVYSSIVFFDTTKQEEIISEINLEDNLIVELYCNNSKILAVGSEYSVCYNKSGVELWRISYEDKECKTFDISDEGNIAFLFNRFNSEQSESYVEIYNFSGNLCGKYKSSENIRTISVNNDYCLLSASKSTVLIDSDGDAYKTKQIPFGFYEAVLYNNYNFGFVVNDRMCEIISVKN